MTVEINSNPEVKYPVICAWCGKVTGWSVAKRSHSICRECSERLLIEAPLFARQEKTKNERQELNE